MCVASCVVRHPLFHNEGHHVEFMFPFRSRHASVYLPPPHGPSVAPLRRACRGLVRPPDRPGSPSPGRSTATPPFRSVSAATGGSGHCSQGAHPARQFPWPSLTKLPAASRVHPLRHPRGRRQGLVAGATQARQQGQALPPKDSNTRVTPIAASGARCSKKPRPSERPGL